MSKAQQRYKQKVKKEWFKEPGFDCYEEQSVYEVKCRVCSTKTVKPVLLNVQNRGKRVLRDHLKTDKHLTLKDGVDVEASAKTSTSIQTFFGSQKQVDT